MGTSAGRPRDPAAGRSRDNGQSISLNSALKHIELTFKVCNNAKKTSTSFKRSAENDV